MSCDQLLTDVLVLAMKAGLCIPEGVTENGYANGTPQGNT